ncbi:hypothetical protein Tco_0925885 [Tanacetum coccineum]|uniref:Uncharacterized protein n=1 Tax=Tanacetum coccineum TaxID=301880 RepID=A0ABQ5D842_9ASTR
MIFSRQVNRVHVLDFEGLTKGMRQALIDRLRMVYTGAEGQDLFTSLAWRKHRARMSGSYFMRHLAEHFGLVTEEGIWGLTMVVGELRVIDMDELVEQEGRAEGVHVDPTPVQAPQAPWQLLPNLGPCHKGWRD